MTELEEKLFTALAPLAALADAYEDESMDRLTICFVPGRMGPRVGLTLGDARRARALIAACDPPTIIRLCNAVPGEGK